MKKTIITLLTGILLLVLAGCSQTDVPDANQAPSENNTIATSKVDTCSPPNYVSFDKESFLADWAKAQTNPDSMNQHLAPDSTNSATTKRLVFPVLPPEAYALWAVEVSDSICYFRYVPIEDAGIKYFEDTDGITVEVSKADMPFDWVVEQNNWEQTNGVVYLSKVNKWYTHCDEKLVGILLPKTVVLENASALKQFLTFETYIVQDDSAVLNNNYVTE